MHRWWKSSINNHKRPFLWVCLWGLLVAGAGEFLTSTALAQEAKVERVPITFRVVAVNPSQTKTYKVPVKFYLPQEVTPRDILDAGGLEFEYDEQKASYFVYKDGVGLAPRETKVFDVIVRDVWAVPEPELASLKEYTSLVLSRLEKSPYYDAAKPIADSIFQRLTFIAKTQVDESLGRKQYIGVYRINLKTIGKIKEDLVKMEKLLSFTGGPPVPQMLQESRLKSDAPTTKTTWLLVLMIVVFLGLFGGLFFFPWNRRVKDMKDFSSISQVAFPQDEQPAAPEPPADPSDSHGKAA